MKTVKSCEFNNDTACVEVVCENGSTLYIYTPMVEEFLRTTAHSRSKLDWLIENEPLEYVRMVIDGTLQSFIDTADDTVREQLRNYTERLEGRFSPSIAEDIAREIIMYS